MKKIILFLIILTAFCGQLMAQDPVTTAITSDILGANNTTNKISPTKLGNILNSLHDYDRSKIRDTTTIPSTGSQYMRNHFYRLTGTSYLYFYDATGARMDLQGALTSGTNIKTINGVSILGAGDLTISGMIGATTGVNGQSGTVPQPLAGATNRALMSDAQYKKVVMTDSAYVTLTQGNVSTDSLVSSAIGGLKRLSIKEVVESKGWGLVGNSGTTAGVNFMGTTDSIDLILKSNSTERLRIKANGNVGIGTINPTTQFEVGGVTKLHSTYIDNNRLWLRDTTTTTLFNFNGLGIGNNDLYKHWAIGNGYPTDNTKNALAIYEPNSGKIIMALSSHQTVGIGNIGYNGSPLEADSSQLSVYSITNTALQVGGNGFNTNCFVVKRSLNGNQATSSGAIGVNVTNPQYTIDIDSRVKGAGNPMRLQGLNVGAKTDSIVTSLNGILREIAVTEITNYANWRKITGNYTVAATDRYISVENEAAAVTITFPKASDFPNRLLSVKRVFKAGGLASTGTITITPTTNATSQAGNIETGAGIFAASTTLAATGTIGAKVTYISNGGEWELVND